MKDPECKDGGVRNVMFSLKADSGHKLSVDVSRRPFEMREPVISNTSRLLQRAAPSPFPKSLTVV